MSVVNYEDLKVHLGHRIVCVSYGENKENIALECEDCNEVLLDFDIDSVNLLNFKTIQCQILNELCKHGDMSKSRTAEVAARSIVDNLL